MASVFERAAAQAVKRSIKVPESVKKSLAIGRAASRGDADALVDLALQKLLGRFIEPTKYQLIGGIPMDEVREIYKQMASTEWSKQNIWHIAIEDIQPSKDSLPNKQKDINLFAMDCSYTPITIVGEATPVGSGSYDQITNGERVELRITTRDDIQGNIKRWVKDLAARMTREDGTFGLPVDYLVRITVTHAFVSDNADGAIQAVTDKYIMRLGSVEYNKDRRQDALEELTISFTQFDTFTSVK